MYSIYVKRKVYIRKSCVAIFHHHYCSTVITWTSDKSTRETGKEYIPTLHYLAGVSLSLSFFFFLSSMIVSYPPPWRFQMEVFTRRSLENKEKWIDSQRDKSYRWVHIEKVMQRKKKGGGESIYDDDDICCITPFFPSFLCCFQHSIHSIVAGLYLYCIVNMARNSTAARSSREENIGTWCIISDGFVQSFQSAIDDVLQIISNKWCKKRNTFSLFFF